MSSLFSISERIVSQKGSGAHVIAGLLILIVGAAFGLSTGSDAIVYAAIVIGLAITISAFLMIIKQYERAIILRIGKYQRQAGPGVQSRIPFVDSVLVVDVREKVREFKAERMLTKDNVPATIDAILRYRIIEERARDAVLNVENFNQMIQQVSQTTLRNNIGSSVFQDILSRREEVNQHIKAVIASEASNWGIEVTGVEIRQVIIPQELEAAMSMQAQAEREKSARVTYGESEVLVAKQFQEASRVYENNHVAYALAVQHAVRIDEGTGQHHCHDPVRDPQLHGLWKPGDDSGVPGKHEKGRGSKAGGRQGEGQRLK